MWQDARKPLLRRALSALTRLSRAIGIGQHSLEEASTIENSFGSASALRFSCKQDHVGGLACERVYPVVCQRALPSDMVGGSLFRGSRLLRPAVQVNSQQSEREWRTV